MEVDDCMFYRIRDWDPAYLSSIFDVDFYDYSEMWQSGMGDSELLHTVTELEKYCPIVEDISIDDEELCNAVERIESE